MNRTLLVVSVLVLSFVGLADSWYLYQSAVSDTALYCDIGAALDGCNIVAQSAYSKLFGIPLALYGVLFFAALFVLGALLLSVHKRVFYRALYLLSIAGSLASLVFLYIQFVLIKALCIYCIASAVFMFLICFAARSLWKRFAPIQVL